MTGRRVRNLVILAVFAGVGYWIYKDRPTVSGLIDSLTSPLMRSKTAVRTSEDNRAVGDQSAAAAQDQTELPVGSLHEGMTSQEVRSLLGAPDRVDEEIRDDGQKRIRWNYERARRVVVLREGRVVSIVVK